MRKKTIGEHKISAILKHCDKFYDYSEWPKVVTNNKSKVEIVCSAHGVFSQTISNHINFKQGCPECGVIKRSDSQSKSKEDYVVAAKNTHGDRYDYSKWPVRVRSHSKVSIGCPEHGCFIQSIGDHVSGGKGCPKCANTSTGLKQRTTLQGRIEQAQKIHGCRYDYSNWSEDIKATSKVEIICPEHGSFSQSLTHHIHGRNGCPECTAYGFQNSKPGYLYVLDNGEALKFGISNTPDRRFSNLTRDTPFSFKRIALYMFPIGYDARECEKNILEVCDSAQLKDFDGSTEWVIRNTTALNAFNIVKRYDYVQLI